MAKPQIKGSALIPTVKTLRALGKERARALLPPELHKYLEERLLPSLWYPEEEFAELLRVAGKLVQPTLPDPREDVFVVMGRAATKAAFATLYANVLDKVDPVRTLERGASLWPVYHDTGTTHRTFPAPGRATIEVEGHGHPSAEFCRLQVGFFEEMLAQSGATRVKCVETRCVNQGDPSCLYELEWELAQR